MNKHGKFVLGVITWMLMARAHAEGGEELQFAFRRNDMPDGTSIFFKLPDVHIDYMKHHPPAGVNLKLLRLSPPMSLGRPVPSVDISHESSAVVGGNLTIGDGLHEGAIFPAGVNGFYRIKSIEIDPPKTADEYYLRFGGMSPGGLRLSIKGRTWGKGVILEKIDVPMDFTLSKKTIWLGKLPAEYSYRESLLLRHNGYPVNAMRCFSLSALDNDTATIHWSRVIRGIHRGEEDEILEQGDVPVKVSEVVEVPYLGQLVLDGVVKPDLKGEAWAAFELKK